MPFNEPAILDNFNRANAATLGANWTADLGGASYDSIGIVANEATHDGAGTLFQSNYWNVEQFDHDQAVKAKCVVKGTTNPMRLYLGIQDPGAFYNAYEVEVAGANTYISKAVAGVRTTLVNTGVAFANGDIVGFQRVGSALEVWQNAGSGWTLNGSTTDSAITGAGYGGLLIQNDADATWDDFGAMSILAPSNEPSILRVSSSGLRW